MAAGQHTSKRVALAIPPKLYEQLAAWAEFEGRPVASLCLYLIENSIRQAQREGLAPSWRTEQEENADGLEEYEFTGSRHKKKKNPEQEEKEAKLGALLDALDEAMKARSSDE